MASFSTSEELGDTRKAELLSQSECSIWDPNQSETEPKMSLSHVAHQYSSGIFARHFIVMMWFYILINYDNITYLSSLIHPPFPSQLSRVLCSSSGSVNRRSISSISILSVYSNINIMLLSQRMKIKHGIKVSFIILYM